jgi:peptidyl-prolyl cis-trans isomerase SurA
MKTVLLFPAVGSSLMLAFISSVAAQPVEAIAAAAPQSNGIAAVVNGRPILRSEVAELNKFQAMELRASIMNRTELDQELKNLEKKTLDTLVEQELILKEFEPYAASMKDKIDAYTDEHIKSRWIKDTFKGDRAKFQQDLTASGMSYKRFYEKQRIGVIVQVMRGQNVNDVGYITSDEKQAYLQSHLEDFRDGDQIKLWSISIPKVSEEPGTTPKSQLALAREIRSKLGRGDDFATLARTYSHDSKSSKGGDWGMITKKDFSRRLSDQVFKMPAKKITDVIDYDDSYYIFYVEAKIPGKMKPDEEVQAELEKRVLMEKRKKAYEQWIQQLRRKATISYK